jgi:hypothetical protein
MRLFHTLYLFSFCNNIFLSTFGASLECYIFLYIVVHVYFFTVHIYYEAGIVLFSWIVKIVHSLVLGASTLLSLSYASVELYNLN